MFVEGDSSGTGAQRRHRTICAPLSNLWFARPRDGSPAIFRSISQGALTDLGAITDFITAIFNMRAPGATLHKMPLFVHLVDRLVDDVPRRLAAQYRFRFWRALTARCCSRTDRHLPAPPSSIRRAAVIRSFFSMCSGSSCTPKFTSLILPWLGRHDQPDYRHDVLPVAVGFRLSRHGLCELVSIGLTGLRRVGASHVHGAGLTADTKARISFSPLPEW